MAAARGNRRALPRCLHSHCLAGAAARPRRWRRSPPFWVRVSGEARFRTDGSIAPRCEKSKTGPGRRRSADDKGWREDWEWGGALSELFVVVVRFCVRQTPHQVSPSPLLSVLSLSPVFSLFLHILKRRKGAAFPPRASNVGIPFLSLYILSLTKRKNKIKNQIKLFSLFLFPRFSRFLSAPPAHPLPNKQTNKTISTRRRSSG